MYPNVDATDPNVGVPFNHTYIDFDLGNYWAANGFTANACALNGAGFINALPNALVTIYPAGGGVPIICMVSPTIINFKAHYDFSNCKTTWNGGDSMVVKAKYVVNAPIQYLTGIQTQWLFDTKVQVYSSYVAMPTPTTAPVLQGTYTCDKFNSNLTIYNISHSGNGNTSVLNGCNSYISYGDGVFTTDNGDNSKFLYEVRDFGTIDVSRVRLPQGFTYKPNSAKFYAYYTPSSATVAIPDSKITAVGNVVTISDLKSFFKTYGGSLDITDETHAYNFYFEVIPSCQYQGNVVLNMNVSSTYVGNGINTPTVWKFSPDLYYTKCSNINQDSSDYTTGLSYNGPKTILTGGGSIITNTGDGTWNVQTQNQSATAPALNSYLYLGASSMNNYVVRALPSNTIILLDANGFYELGTLAASGSQNYSITASLNKCSIDSIPVRFGWGCSGYPTSAVGLSSCTPPIYLKAGGYPSALDATFDALLTGPGSTVPACSPFEVEVLINSNLIGNLDNELYKVTLPTGLNYVPNSVKVLFPAGGSYVASTYNPTVITTVTGEIINFDVNSVTGNIGLTGVSDLSKNQVKIKYQLQSKCGFISGNILKTNISGSSACGDKVATIVKTSSAVKLTGANATSQFSIRYSSPDTLKTCGVASTATIVVKNTGTAPAVVNDSLSIDLGIGLHYELGSFVTIRNGPSSTAPVINVNTLKWQIPSTVAPGDSMKFTINVIANSAGCGSNSVDLYTTQSIVLACGTSTCNTPVITGRLITVPIITFCCPCVAPKITNVSVTRPTCNGSTINSDAAVSVTGIKGGIKYSYGTNGTTGLYFASATTFSGATISVGSLPNPASPKTYTFRIYAYPLDSTCYNDTIVILNPTNPNLVPTFDAVAPICSGTTLATLPTTSTNGVTGTWLPILDNTVTKTYIFTPTTGSCASTATLTITVNPSPSFNVVQTNVSCFGSNDGVITISTANGTSPYNYSKDNGLNFQTSNIFNNLLANTYNIVMKDNIGCINTKSISITEPMLLTINNTLTQPTCNNNDGAIDLSVVGSNSTPIYNWSNGATTEDLSGLSAGTYTVTITSNTCTKVLSYDLEIMKTNITYSFCAGDSYKLEISNAGLTNIQWQLNGINIAGANGSTFNATQIGIYTYTSNNVGGCAVGQCCPIELVAGTNCCKSVICLPVRLTRN